MIQFNQYIIEVRKKSPGLNEFNEFISHVNKNCSPWLKKSGGAHIYRGMKGFSDEIYLNFKVRKDRKPRETSAEITKKLDLAFHKNFKIKTQTQCIFISGEHGHASLFGHPYIVFPVGKFNFIWSSKIKDLNFDEATKEYKKFKTQEEYDKWVKKYYVKNKNLIKAINSENEIMVECDSYCAISYNFYHLIKNKFAKSIIKFKK